MSMLGTWGTRIAVAAALASPGVAGAETRYACSALDGGVWPVIEGAGGVFFDLETDLLSDARLPGLVVEQIARVSEVLAARGTELIVVPVPTKGQLFPEALGHAAGVYRFDPALARGLYRDTLLRLSEVGVIAVDAQAALRVDGNDWPVFRTDPRLTNTGIRQLAEAVAGVLPLTLGGNTRVETAGRVTVPSVKHLQVQSRCHLSLPPMETVAYDTVSLTSDARAAEVVLATTGEMSGEGLVPGPLFANALSRSVLHVESDGSALEAIVQVVAGDAFHTAPPKALVWVFPVGEDLARFGARPFEEIGGLVADRCGAGVTMTPDGDAWTVDVDLAGRDATLGLRVSLEDGAAERVDFAFRGPDGQERRRSIVRQTPTERFLMPLDRTWPAGASLVEVALVADVDTPPSVSLCEVPG
ncbi:MAG: hypothetical protein AAF762_05475 [Pseudomonadota bacterium]